MKFWICFGTAFLGTTCFVGLSIAWAVDTEKCYDVKGTDTLLCSGCSDGECDWCIPGGGGGNDSCNPDRRLVCRRVNSFTQLPEDSGGNHKTTETVKCGYYVYCTPPFPCDGAKCVDGQWTQEEYGDEKEREIKGTVCPGIDP